ncbi:Dipeptidebinding ABC transporter periplasmic substratebinding component TC 3A152 Putative heminbinding lipoprotein CDS [Bradyrhizobium sp.]|uniref:ABC transporter substrate-binding protein n=1 Tax=Bradyrhizobium sp. TaxID=376 RepID=UPI0007C1F3C0|nr:ABC transporter substrate-binding protein [Bradyrhizobium sp.]CUU17917.1 Dipeptidebinding ABC transporter periplasmic substratebinding component TC 3A152 Putative heminbinding lipoprotein CDS [Bradyrhizobium sp.]
MFKLKAFIPALFGLALVAAPAHAAGNLVAVLEAEIVTLDPHFSTAYISRTFGYMVFDTLFAKDSKGDIKPQMVQDWKVSSDGLTYTFTLRDGLKWHDGQPVTAADCVASLRRWGTRSALGRRIFAITASLEPTDAKTFVLTLKEPSGLVIDALGNPVSPVAFMMPERIAKTPGDQRITEIIGSGPFVYSKADHRTGDRMILKKFADYVPRPEPADFLAGGKRVGIDTLEIRVIPDGATAASALQAGEVDFMQYAPFDLLLQLEKNSRVKLVNFTGGNMVDQREVLDALGLDAKYAAPCATFFTCGTTYESKAGTEAAVKTSIEAAKAALKATKYAGEPVVVMEANDLEAPRVSAQVLAERLKQAGFNVDLQVMDWASVLARRAKKEGWSVYGVHAGGFDLGSPLTNVMVAFNCADFTGWQCDARITPLMEAFAKAPAEEDRKKIAGEIQSVMYDQAPAIPWGQFAQPAAYRATLRGLIPSAIPVFWNVEK